MSRRRPSDLQRSQNFLSDPRLIEQLVDSAEISSSDLVYDLGAGRGSLTAALARRARRVVAVEKDPRLVEQLRRRFAGRTNVAVHEADLLKHPLPRSDYVVFANPPFDITARLLGALTFAPVPPRAAYLVLQREAVERLLGRPRMTLAALLIAPWFSLTPIHRFRRADFFPAPSVDALFVKLRKRGPPLVPPEEAPLYRDFIVAAFSGWRPTIGESLRHTLGRRAGARLLTAARIDGGATPSGLPLVAWLDLYREFAAAPDAIRGRVNGSEARLRRQQRRLKKVHRARAPRDSLRRVAKLIARPARPGWLPSSHPTMADRIARSR